MTADEYFTHQAPRHDRTPFETLLRSGRYGPVFECQPPDRNVTVGHHSKKAQ